VADGYKMMGNAVPVELVEVICKEKNRNELEALLQGLKI